MKLSVCLSALLLIVFSLPPAFAQSWQWQFPRNFGNNLNCVGALDSVTLWASGENGDLLWSTDAGHTWIVRNSMNAPRYKTVFVSNFVGWGINAYQGYEDTCRSSIFFTSDGGFTWIPQYVLPHVVYGGLTDIQFLNSQDGYVIGFRYDANLSWGVLLRTVDGGQTWSEQRLDTLAYTIYFISPTEGWIGSDHILWHTTDGGSTRTLVNANCMGTALLRFTDPTHGWAGAYLLDPHYYDLYKTMDGGVTWTPQGFQLEQNHSIADIQAVNNNVVWALGDIGQIFVTQDGGANWSEHPSNVPLRLNAMCALNSETAWFVGSGGKIVQTIDGGAFCDFQNGSPALPMGIENMDFSDRRHGWVVSGDGIAHTGDGGVTWSVQEIPNDLYTIVSVEAVDSLNAWVCGEAHNILQTTDGGGTWNHFPVRANCSPLRLTHFGSDRLWVVVHDFFWSQSDSVLGRSTDAGASWTFYPAPQPESFTTDMLFVDENNGWRVGEDDEGGYGFISRTRDGGLTWESQLESFESGITSVSFVDSLHGWVCSSFSLLRTVDGGAHWDAWPGSFERPTQVQFFDQQNGWVLANFNQTFRTTDGGATWQNVTCGASELAAMKFTDMQHGWVAGATGVILHFDGTQSSISTPPASSVRDFALSNFPNPFNPLTQILFSIPSTQRVELRVYDITGRLVQTLADRVMNAGEYRIPFDGSALPSGIYFARLNGVNTSKTIKLVMVK